MRGLNSESNLAAQIRQACPASWPLPLLLPKEILIEQPHPDNQVDRGKGLPAHELKRSMSRTIMPNACSNHKMLRRYCTQQPVSSCLATTPCFAGFPNTPKSPATCSQAIGVLLWDKKAHFAFGGLLTIQLRVNTGRAKFERAYVAGRSPSVWRCAEQYLKGLS